MSNPLGCLHLQSQQKFSGATENTSFTVRPHITFECFMYYCVIYDYTGFIVSLIRVQINIAVDYVIFKYVVYLSRLY